MPDRRHIRVLAHNIRSLWNVGSLFRCADCFAVEKLYLSGYTALPPRREIAKTALGAEEWISWEHVPEPLECIRTLKGEGWRIAALEIASGSVPLPSYVPYERTLLIVGHEVTGVPAEQLALADDTVHIPMHGRKESLNVAVATGIALEYLRNH